MKKIAIIILFFGTNFLITNNLSAQSTIKEYKIVGTDSMKYAFNEKGDTIFSAKLEGTDLRLIQEKNSSRIVNSKGETVFEERNPHYPDGADEMWRFLANNIRYPKIARDNGAQGIVYVGFVVDKDGSLTDVHSKALKKIFKAKSEAKKKKEESKIPIESYKAIEEEAVRVVKLMPKWISGMQQNRPVRVAYTMPIKFWLD